jgi:transcriptional regulator with XRE-family HTH domain
VVPRKIGQEMRQRRLLVGMTQANIADAIGTTRAYVSAIERGVTWDPDADKLVLWSKTLGWEPDYLLRKLGRVAVPAPNVGLSPEMLKAIKRAIVEGVREGAPGCDPGAGDPSGREVVTEGGMNPTDIQTPTTDETINAQIDRVRELRLNAFVSYFASDENRIDGALAYLNGLTRHDLLLLAAEDIMRSNDALLVALDGPHGPEDPDTA